MAWLRFRPLGSFDFARLLTASRGHVHSFRGRMRQSPRIAVGTVQPSARREPVLWGLLAALKATADSPVLFRSSCGFAAHDPSQTILGRAAGHLDSWAMSRADTRAALLRASGEGDLAIVEGTFNGSAREPSVASPPASSLDRLSEWLELPRVAILDVHGLTPCLLSVPSLLNGR